MKKIFSAKRLILFSRDKASLGFVVLIFVVFLLFVRFLAPSFFWQMMTPIFNASNAIATWNRGLVTSISNSATLTTRVEELALQKNALILENKMLRKKIASITELKAHYNGSITTNIVAGVLARPPQSPYDTLMLASGRKEGVTVGMTAFGPGGVPLGSISSVYENHSRATLFSAPRIITSGWVGEKLLPITIDGAGGGALTSIVARTAQVEVGDLVYVPGPGALPIGTVARIDSDQSLPGVRLHIQSIINLFSITWVHLRDVETEVSLP